jgi:hypothetical protein
MGRTAAVLTGYVLLVALIGGTGNAFGADALTVLLVPLTFLALYVRRYGRLAQNDGLALFEIALTVATTSPTREEALWFALATGGGAVVAMAVRLVLWRPIAVPAFEAAIADYRAGRRQRPGGDRGELRDRSALPAAGSRPRRPRAPAPPLRLDRRGARGAVARRRSAGRQVGHLSARDRKRPRRRTARRGGGRPHARCRSPRGDRRCARSRRGGGATGGQGRPERGLHVGHRDGALCGVARRRSRPGPARPAAGGARRRRPHRRRRRQPRRRLRAPPRLRHPLPAGPPCRDPGCCRRPASPCRDWSRRW